jgi:hypothetical protein
MRAYFSRSEACSIAPPNPSRHMRPGSSSGRSRRLRFPLRFARLTNHKFPYRTTGPACLIDRRRTRQCSCATKSRTSEPPRAVQFDQRGEQQFVEGVDIYLDTPTRFVTTPRFSDRSVATSRPWMLIDKNSEKAKEPPAGTIQTLDQPCYRSSFRSSCEQCGHFIQP